MLLVGVGRGDYTERRRPRPGGVAMA